MVQAKIIFDLGQLNDSALSHAPTNSKESAISSFLRERAFQKAIPTQLHASQHSVSTLGSVYEDDLSESWAGDDDLASLVPLDNEDIFDGVTAMKDESQHQQDSMLVSDNRPAVESPGDRFDESSYERLIVKALLVSTDDESCSSYDNGWYETFETLKMDDPMDAVQQPRKPAIDFPCETSTTPSMGSLNQAFEKLNACMMKTEESRRRVLLELKDGSLMTSHSDHSSSFVRDDRSVRTSDSTRSFSSSCSGRDCLSQKKGPRSFQKKPRRKRGATKAVSVVNKTGVAFRPSHMALL
jgi:hypothetical protein